MDGIILCSVRLPDAQLLPLIDRHPAVALVNRTALGGNCGAVRVDDSYGAMRAVHHLLIS